MNGTNPRKSLTHGVVNILQCSLFCGEAVVLVDIRAIGQEVPAEESVGEEELTDHDNNVENLTTKEAVEVSVIFVVKLLVESCQ